VIAFLQAAALIFSGLASIVLTQKIDRQPFLKLFPQPCAGVVIALLMGSVIVG
jgi:hypothetical protein